MRDLEAAVEAVQLADQISNILTGKSNEVVISSLGAVLLTVFEQLVEHGHMTASDVDDVLNSLFKAVRMGVSKQS